MTISDATLSQLWASSKYVIPIVATTMVPSPAHTAYFGQLETDRTDDLE